VLRLSTWGASCHVAGVLEATRQAPESKLRGVDAWPSS
jgi:hypothetical protein